MQLVKATPTILFADDFNGPPDSTVASSSPVINLNNPISANTLYAIPRPSKVQDEGWYAASGNDCPYWGKSCETWASINSMGPDTIYAITTEQHTSDTCCSMILGQPEMGVDKTESHFWIYYQNYGTSCSYSYCNPVLVTTGTLDLQFKVWFSNGYGLGTSTFTVILNGGRLVLKPYYNGKPGVIFYSIPNGVPALAHREPYNESTDDPLGEAPFGRIDLINSPDAPTIPLQRWQTLDMLMNYNGYNGTYGGLLLNGTQIAPSIVGKPFPFYDYSAAIGVKEIATGYYGSPTGFWDSGGSVSNQTRYLNFLSQGNNGANGAFTFIDDVQLSWSLTTGVGIAATTATTTTATATNTVSSTSSLLSTTSTTPTTTSASSSITSIKVDDQFNTGPNLTVILVAALITYARIQGHRKRKSSQTRSRSALIRYSLTAKSTGAVREE